MNGPYLLRSCAGSPGDAGDESDGRAAKQERRRRLDHQHRLVRRAGRRHVHFATADIANGEILIDETHNVQLLAVFESNLTGFVDLENEAGG